MLEGWEWIIIGIVAVVIILWGPAKIPEFAKALGRAKGEFEKASKEFQNPTTTINTSTPAVRTKEEVLFETARNLGIATEGKTKEQISKEISERVKAIGSD